MWSWMLEDNSCSPTKLEVFQTKLEVFQTKLEVFQTKLEVFQTKLEVFQTKRILTFYWPTTISNEELRRSTAMDALAEIMRIQRRWWLGHVCRMPSNSIIRTILRWTPHGERKKGRPKETWRRTAEEDLNIRWLSLDMATRAAADRVRWRNLAGATRARLRREDVWECVLLRHSCCDVLR